MNRIETKPPLPLVAPSDANAFLRACLSPASFWTPARIGAQVPWLEHAPFAFWLVEALRPRTLVELGTHGGFSYFALCEAVQRCLLETRCYAVDTWKGDEHAGFYGEDVFDDVRSHNDRRYAAFSTLVRSTFDEAVRHFSDGTIDLLHIDGRHFYSDVKHDFEIWRPKLSHRAIVLFHDTNVREGGFGVFRLWEELRRAYPHFEFLHGHGLGVLGVGAELTSQLRTLLAAAEDAEASSQIRSAYSRIGSTVAVDFRAQQQTAEVVRLGEAFASAETRALDLEKRALAEAGVVARLDQALGDAQARTLDLEERLGAEARLASRLNVELLSARCQVGDLELQVAERSAEVVELQATLAESRECAADLERQFQAITASASWHLTAPLRTFARKAPWLTRQMRRGAKLLWWTATFQLGARLRAVLRRRSDVRLIAKSGLLDRSWYLKRNPDVLASDADPIWHYYLQGGLERRDPNEFFDTNWYLSQYPDVAASGINPLLDYLRCGVPEGRNPGPSFSTRGYLLNNPDVAATGKNPLSHFILYGRAEGRPAIKADGSLPVEADYSLAIPFSYLPAIPTPAPRVAALCHIFYEDLAAEMQQYLSNIPFPLDVFISTDTRSKQAAIQQQFVGWTGGLVEVRLVENRGRDIGPRLIAFRDVYDKYEYVVHLHSKRSDHPALSLWRAFLLNNLIGSSDIVRSILEIFIRFPDVGIVAPQHFEPARRWLSWAGNYGLAEKLAIRMQIGLSPTQLLDFPSGSMFWSRSAALRPLLELNLTVDDFSEEQGQRDETLAHAIERLFYFVCERAGFKWLKIADPKLFEYSATAIRVDTPKALERFVVERTVRLSSIRGPSPNVTSTPMASPRKGSDGGHFGRPALSGITAECKALWTEVQHQTRRIDYALAQTEGIPELATALELARSSPHHAEPFTKPNPLVSVCVATSDRSELLVERCILSLRNQTYSNIQIVVVGDHCLDDTAYRLAQLKDDRIMFENLPRRGPYPEPGIDRWHVAGSNAMNRALELAEGDFITHLDDDDEATCDRIERLLAFVQCGGIEFAWHPFWYEQPNGTWTQIGNGEFKHMQITTGSVFYHKFFCRIRWDVRAYRLNEPGDWNRFRKIRVLRPTMSFLDRCLTLHYKERNQRSFIRQLDETFLY